MGVNHETARMIVERARERAGEGADFLQVHACLVGPDENRNGAEKLIKIPIGSETAKVRGWQTPSGKKILIKIVK
jgi:hypothetical protein